MACRTPQQVAEDHLSQTGRILVPERTPDGTGGSTLTYSDGPLVPCRVTANGDPLETAIAERLSGRPAFRVALPVGTALSLAHRLSVEGRTFEVVGFTEAPGATLGHATVAEVPV